MTEQGNSQQVGLPANKYPRTMGCFSSLALIRAKKRVSSICTAYLIPMVSEEFLRVHFRFKSFNHLSKFTVLITFLPAFSEWWHLVDLITACKWKNSFCDCVSTRRNSCQGSGRWNDQLMSQWPIQLVRRDYCSDLYCCWPSSRKQTELCRILLSQWGTIRSNDLCDLINVFGNRFPLKFQFPALGVFSAEIGKKYIQKFEHDLVNLTYTVLYLSPNDSMRKVYWLLKYQLNTLV